MDWIDDVLRKPPRQAEPPPRHAEAPPRQAEPPPKKAKIIEPHRVPETGQSFRDCEVCPEMMVVAAGRFMMGSPANEPGRGDDEGPQHLVTIANPFAAGKFEVTFDEWDACVGEGQCTEVADAGLGRGRRPVINVNWTQAIGYAKWLADKTGKKYRLLSEAEWEYAARAGSEQAWFWGSSPGRGCEYANVYDVAAAKYFGGEAFTCDDGYPDTAPVGSFKSNAFGLHDMAGNAWEWVEDCYNGTYDAAPANGQVWSKRDCSRRVYRGGNWFSHPPVVRSAIRNRDVPSARFNDLGFRVARTLP